LNHTSSVDGDSPTVVHDAWQDTFVLGDRHPRHLHSFPTRRSSDLYAYFDTGFDPALRAWLARPAGRLFFAGEHTSIRWQGYMNGDRKSTRLNSSHVKISYAVFCLKKKKIDDDIICVLALISSDALH